jgi:hypothetical protein
MKTFIGLEIFSADGKLIERRPFEEAHSFVSNFMHTLYGLFANATINLGVNTASNTARTLCTAGSYNSLSVIAAANVTAYGIQIGTGTTAPAFSDYKLATQTITNVYHFATTAFLNNPSASVFEIIINRSFSNNTGAAITINEVGLVGYYAGSGDSILLDRTLYTVTVGIGMAITLTYKFTFTL